jgi:RNA polymerase sigma-70 factor, ECF subfamily
VNRDDKNSFVSMASTDQLLIARVRDGDEDAATEFYERYVKRVFGLVESEMGNQLRARVEPEDIVQSVFRSIFRGMKSGGYDAPESGSLWKLLAVIATHKVRRSATRHSAAKRDTRTTLSLDAMASPGTHSGLAPEELEQAIREAIEFLDESEQTVVLLRIQSYSVEEISVRMQRSRRTVERTLHRVRQKLLDCLDE